MKKFLSWIKRLFTGVKDLANKYVKPSISVVEALKKAVDSPVMPVLTALIPGNIDNIILAKLAKVLPQVLKVLRIADECSSKTDPQEIVICAIKNLKNYEPDARKATYHSIASMLAVYLSDKKLSWSEAVHLTEYLYKGNEATD